ncbi:hypothetical protein BKA69DRAFT_1079194 [Paraphysoderma sedebokerense]|nr:hypothetical protein BKA69DRAFT_1079194 [Paraphysoderma sedebokerense]
MRICGADSIPARPVNSAVELRFILQFLDVKSYLGRMKKLSIGNREEIFVDILSSIHDWLIHQDVYMVYGIGMKCRLLPIVASKSRRKASTSSPTSPNSDPTIRQHTLYLTALLRCTLFPFEIYHSKTHPLPIQKLMTLITIHVFSQPLLLTAYDISWLEMFKSTLMFPRLIELLSDSQSLRIIFNALEGNGSLCLVGNLMDLRRQHHSSPVVKSSAVEFKQDFKQIILSLLRHCQNYVSHKSSNLVQFHPVFNWYSGKPDPSLTQIHFQALIKQIELLWSREFIVDMFKPVLEFNSDYQSTKKSTNSLIPLISIDMKDLCSLYLVAFKTLPAHKSDIKTSLAYTSKLVPSLWRFLNSLGPNGDMQIYLNAVQNPDKEPLIPILELFFELAILLFFTLDDIEVYEKETPFSLTELVSLSSFLNRFVFQIYWNNFNPSMPNSHPPILKSARKLLTLLYDRDIRRPFSKDKKFSWSLKETTSSSFRKLLNDKDPKAMNLLNIIPHTIPFDLRVKIFRGWAETEKSYLPEMNYIVTVNRSNILEDGFEQLSRVTGQQFKHTIRVKFINELGLVEAGIDQNGVFKEFLEETLKQAFNPNLSLFQTTSDSLLYPSLTSSIHANHLQLFEFVGKTLGKAVYEGIVIDAPFAPFFLSKLLGRYNYLDELPSLDPVLYKNLTFLKHYEGDAEDLCLSFTISENVFGQTTEKEIKPGGKGITVTNENKIQYVYLMADYRLNKSIKEQSEAFIKGFRSVIPPLWTSIFSPPELQRLISGDDVDIDIQDLRRNTIYQGYFDKHKVIINFWSVFSEFSKEEKQKFLKFCTSCSKPPLLGFSNLNPKFTIRFVPADDSADPSSPSVTDTASTVTNFFGSLFGVGKDTDRLPTSSTCFNLLKLPAYKKKSTLREKLRLAINSGAGFELS